MQRHFISPVYGYYTAADGVQIDPDDTAVPDRPSDAHQWSGSAWVFDRSVALGRLRSASIDAVRQHLNKVAQVHGYDSIEAAVSYADEPAVPRFQADGRALRAWRSLVWDRCFQMLDDADAGRIDVAGPDAIIAALPAIQPIRI